MVKLNLIAATLAAGMILGTVAPGSASLFIDYPNFSNPTVSFQLNGAASVVEPSGVLRVVPDVGSSAGSMFLSVPISILGNDFVSRFQFQVTGTLPVSARSDGLAFVVQNDLRGASALGDAGESIGYGFNPGSGNPPGPTPIHPSVDIEFDTYQNSFDLNDHHVGIMENGDDQNHLAVGTPNWLLDDGEIKTATIYFDHMTQLLTTVLTSTGPSDTSPLAFSDKIDVNSITGDNVLFGFTAATGGGSANYDVLNWQLGVAPTIPEPASVSLLGMGLIALALLRRGLPHRSQTDG